MSVQTTHDTKLRVEAKQAIFIYAIFSNHPSVPVSRNSWSPLPNPRLVQPLYSQKYWMQSSLWSHNHPASFNSCSLPWINARYLRTDELDNQMCVCVGGWNSYLALDMSFNMRLELSHSAYCDGIEKGSRISTFFKGQWHVHTLISKTHWLPLTIIQN